MLTAKLTVDFCIDRYPFVKFVFNVNAVGRWLASSVLFTITVSTETTNHLGFQVRTSNRRHYVYSLRDPRSKGQPERRVRLQSTIGARRGGGGRLPFADELTFPRPF